MSWIKSVRKVKNREDEWKNSLDKVENLVKNEKLNNGEEPIWQFLELQGLYPELIIARDGQKRLQKKLWSYAVWTLVDACIRAHKRYLEQSNSL